MASTGWKPDVVVGIDVGMTCTAVSHSIEPWNEPRTIQKWPAKHSSERMNKVPTAVSYDKQAKLIPNSWGARALDVIEPNNPAHGFTARLFKLFLDPTSIPNVTNSCSVEEARRYYRDYLSCLCPHILNFFETNYPRAKSKNFEFLFSTPTTWNDPSQIAELKSLIQDAGFGNHPNYQVVISLTEAEAAAIYASKEGYVKDDIIIVCDAGGGTTDVNVFKVQSNGLGGTHLEMLTHVAGENVGSILIDWQIEQTIARKLRTISRYLKVEPDIVAEKMMSEGRFEQYKCDFEYEQQYDLHLNIEGMEPGCYFPHANIDDSKMIITREEIRQAFDTQFERMFALIDGQLQNLRRNHENEKVNFLVLSGGLGSSPYLREKFKQQYQRGGAWLPWNAQDITIMEVPEPQLAVVQGLVSCRVQELRGQAGVYETRRARNSYGILCRKLYNRQDYRGADVSKDQRDDMIWAEKQIDWLIQQGKPISIQEGVSMQFRHKIDLGEEHRPFKLHIVRSGRHPESLPRSLKEEGVEIICTLSIKLSLHDMERMNHHWYDRGDEYRVAEFTVRVMVEPAELKFAVYGKDGRRKDIGENGVIAVQWIEHGHHSRRAIPEAPARAS